MPVAVRWGHSFMASRIALATRNGSTAVAVPRFQGLRPAFTEAQSTRKTFGSWSSRVSPATSGLFEEDGEDGPAAVGELDAVARTHRDAAAGGQGRSQALAVGALDHEGLSLIERLQLQARRSTVQPRRAAADRFLGFAEDDVVGHVLLVPVPIAASNEVVPPRRGQRDRRPVAIAPL